MKILEDLLNGEQFEYTLTEDGLITYQGRIYVPDVHELREHILKEAHNPPSIYILVGIRCIGL